MAAAQRILETCEIPDVRYAMPYAELRRSVMGVGTEVGDDESDSWGLGRLLDSGSGSPGNSGGFRQRRRWRQRQQ